MDAKLYVIPASHPSRTAMMMLDLKGIPYKRVDLMPVISKGVLRAVGFPGITVPALKLDGKKIQGSREIARELDRLRLQARRLVWLNPRPAEVDGQPLAIGMRAALPYVDDFVAGHDPRAIERLAKLIGGLGSGRPVRRQRALGFTR